MNYQQVVEKIKSEFKVTIYRRHLMMDYESVLVIIHHFRERDNWISVRIEFGRRFKDIVVYREEGETLESMQKRFAIEFEKWLNTTDQ